MVSDPAGMRHLGAALGAVLGPRSLLLLSGELGAGKTTLVQGLALGLGIRDTVASPTFTLLREHPGTGGRPGLVHLDFYRLAGEEEARDLGLADYLDGPDVVAVEWPERAPGALPEEGLWIRIAVLDSGRRLTLEARGAVAAAALGALAAADEGPS